MVKRSSFGTFKKRLSDITNLHSQHRSPAKEKQLFTPPLDQSSTEDYIQQLLKENAVMMKLIQERDKIIETTGLEMHKLRNNLQKTRLQNWHLAQSNSHMLAELNLGKDRLKALQHELACRDALIQARTVELEYKKGKIKCQTNERQEKNISVEKEAAVNSEQPKNNDKESKEPTTKKKQPARGRSMTQQAGDREMAENKRRCLKRHSMRLKPHQKPQVDLFEMEDFNNPMNEYNDDAVHKPYSATKEDKIASQSQRSSLGRPLRRAAEKVPSYKEPSLVVKMRRPGSENVQ